MKVYRWNRIKLVSFSSSSCKYVMDLDFIHYNLTESGKRYERMKIDANHSMSFIVCAGMYVWMAISSWLRRNVCFFLNFFIVVMRWLLVSEILLFAFSLNFILTHFDIGFDWINSRTPSWAFHNSCSMLQLYHYTFSCCTKKKTNQTAQTVEIHHQSINPSYFISKKNRMNCSVE